MSIKSVNAIIRQHPRTSAASCGVDRLDAANNLAGDSLRRVKEFNEFWEQPQKNVLFEPATPFADESEL